MRAQRLAGQFAVVTGAAGGIGGAIVDCFEREGCKVAALDRRPAAAGSLRLCCDVGSDDALREVVATLGEQSFSPTIVVHAAALGDRRDTFETDPAFLAQMFDVNVGGALRLVQAFAPAMVGRGAGCFLFVSSINSAYATPGLAAYAASKAALDNLVRTVALELAPSGVRANLIRPASIDTPMLRQGFDAAADSVAARERNVARHPLGRLGTPEDVASLALFLCSSEAGWITGADYLIDGGASLTRR